MADFGRILGKAMRGAADAYTPVAMAQLEEQAIAKRDARLAELRKGEIQQEQQFRAGQAAQDRIASAEQARLDREAQSNQGELDRQSRERIAGMRERTREILDPETGEYITVQMEDPDSFGADSRDDAIMAYESGRLDEYDLRKLAQRHGWAPPGADVTPPPEAQPSGSSSGSRAEEPAPAGEDEPQSRPRDEDVDENGVRRPGILGNFMKFGRAGVGLAGEGLEGAVNAVKGFISGQIERSNIREALPQLEEAYRTATGEEKAELKRLIDMANEKLGEETGKFWPNGSPIRR